MGRSKVSTDQLTEYIETRILAGTFQNGDALPSVRRLAAKFKLSFGTAYRALEHLVTEGWLIRREGEGFRVNAPPSSDGYGMRIAVIMEVSSESINSGYLCYHVLLGLRAAAAQSGCFLQITQLSCEQLDAVRLKKITAGAAGVIFVGSYDLKMWEMHLGCPAVGLLMLNSYGGVVSTVNIDLFDTVRQASHFFADRTIVRSVIFTSAKPFYLALGKMFRAAMQEHGSAELVIGMPEEKLVFTRGTGYFFTSDHILQMVSERYFREFGVPLAHDHVVLGVDGKRLINPEYHSFPTLALDWEYMGLVAFDELRRRLQAPDSPARSQSVAGHLVE